MSDHKVKILEIENVTHDVKLLKLEKPEGFSFTPGQAADVAINKPGYIEQKRSFTFTGLNEWDYLEFTIKIYHDHNGVTKEIDKLKTGDELIISEPWGAIEYKGEGTFIAGGAGVTPFIAILRDLKSKNKIDNNKLIFANKTKDDIIHKTEFEDLLENNFINILSDEKVDGYANGFITEEFLKSSVDDFSKTFYLCGPPPMMDALEKQLANLNVDKEAVVKEEF
ncbi:MAG: flavodoxin reductase [Ignavibacteriae bacterium]|nr:flavodoxin reductase [Ignavibacteriota bacterium]NOG98580.1 flavodoxin reductase [Ignavibacteriota bacterium]